MEEEEDRESRGIGGDEVGGRDKIQKGMEEGHKRRGEWEYEEEVQGYVS